MQGLFTLLYVSLGHVKEAAPMYIGICRDKRAGAAVLQAVWEELKEELLGTEVASPWARKHTAQLQACPSCV